jgi:glucose dehydrogenase
MHSNAASTSIPSRRTSASGQTCRRFVLLPIAAGLLLAGGARLHHPASVFAAFHKIHASGNKDWPAYNGGADGDHYSNLNQINRNTVARLKTAWVLDLHEKGELQTNPLIIGLTLYGYTTKQSVIAVNAVTGARLWTFNPEEPSEQPARGLSYWTDGKTRILLAGGVSYLYALDPETGKPLPGFGERGRVDLRRDLVDPGVDYKQTFAAMTSPGVIYRDLIIVGFRLPETEPALRGDIRAFDVHTGALRWTFHTIPHPGEPGYETWIPNSWKTSGSANNWAGMAVDEKRGIVYVPTGSAVNDFYGFDRLGDDLYADTLLALDANTGQRLWHFQEVHHDIWDRDFPSPPALITVRSHGRTVDAVAEPTKQGFLYLFDRVTGKPLFPVNEEPFPASTVPGEKASPTQPVPLAPAPYARQLLTADMLTTRTPAAHAWALEHFKGFISNGLFVPLSLDKQTVVFPGFDGGAEWGGPAVDPRTGVIYINANDIAWTGGLTESRASGTPGAILYQNQCSACHGVNLAGSPPDFPSLINITNRLSNTAILTAVHNGKGRMPSFPNINGASETELLSYLKNPDTEALADFVRPVGPDRTELAGAKVYDRNCAICHGEDLLGAPSNYPGLIGARGRLGDKQILEIIHGGKGRMPASTKLSDSDTAALLRFLGASSAPLIENAVAAGNSTKQEVESTLVPARGAVKYRFTGYRKFLDPDGYPAIQPPWGTLNAIDLNTGRYLWKIPLGEYPELTTKGINNTGSENYGGPLVTAGGLVIIAATNYDRKIRAFNSSTGQLLWSADLPYAGNATPATYMIDGKQYIVLATSGARDTKGPQGAAYVAFALP